MGNEGRLILNHVFNYAFLNDVIGFEYPKGSMDFRGENPVVDAGDLGILDNQSVVTQSDSVLGEANSHEILSREHGASCRLEYMVVLGKGITHPLAERQELFLHKFIG